METWATERNTRTRQSNIPTDIADLSNDEELQSCLSLFVLEARKKGGSEYPPQTLHHIVCGLVRFLQRTRPVFQDANFSQFRATLDAEMKRLKQAGVGSRAQQVEALSDADEDLLWSKKILGDHSPKALLNTVFFLNGVCFALRSGGEHRQLRHGSDSQIKEVERDGERASLEYVEDSSKNNSSGLRARKIKPKRVIQHENTEDPSRCPVRLYKLYLSHCPTDAKAFYLSP